VGAHAPAISYAYIMRTRPLTAEEASEAAIGLSIERNPYLRWAMRRSSGGGVETVAADDHTLVALGPQAAGALGAWLSDPGTLAGAAALGEWAAGARRQIALVTGPEGVASAFVRALAERQGGAAAAATWSSRRSLQMSASATAMAATGREDGLRCATAIEGPFDEWMRAFVAEAFAGGGGPPDVPRDRLFVGVHEGRPVTMAGLLDRGESARVVTVYTPPEERGRGHAGSLVAALAALSGREGFAHVTLDVDVDNTPARRAYERAGFGEISRTENIVRTDR